MAEGICALASSPYRGQEYSSVGVGADTQTPHWSVTAPPGPDAQLPASWPSDAMGQSQPNPSLGQNFSSGGGPLAFPACRVFPSV